MWLLHVAGFIVMQDVRLLTQQDLQHDTPTADRDLVDRVIDATIARFMTIADGVTGGFESEEFKASLKVIVQLDDARTGETVQALDLFDSDGACGPLDDWAAGDYGRHPVATPKRS